MFNRSTSLMAVLSVCVLGLVACNTPPTPPAAPLDKLASLRARGTLIIATDPAYPPQSELKPNAARATETKCAAIERTANEFTGFDVDTAIELAKRLGVEPCFVTPQWSQLIAGNWSDHWDISVGSMSITWERMEVLYFSQPYYATPIEFFVHQDNTTFTQPSDLSGRRIGVCAGCTFENYLKGTLNLPGPAMAFLVEEAEIVAYDTEDPALRDLALGDGFKLDAVLTQRLVGETAIRSGMPLKVLGEPVYFAYAAAAMDKKSGQDPTSFVQEVTRLLQAMHSDGTLSALSQKYHGQDFASAASQFDWTTLKQFP